MSIRVCLIILKKNKCYFNCFSLSGLQHNAPMNIGPLRDFVFKKAKETVMKKTLGLYPAPLKILDVNQIF